MKRHLIVGAGNMGRRYAVILTKLNESVELHDLEFQPKQYDRWDIIKSVLICTPPETHVDLCNLIPPEIPVFCEKPLTVDLDKKPIIRDISMVSIPWFFCKCINSISTEKIDIKLNYRSDCTYRNLDLIHFYSWFSIKDKVVKGLITESQTDPYYALMRLNGFRDLNVKIEFTEPNSTLLNNKPIHKEKFCDMFDRQMQHWLDVVNGYKSSINDFSNALRDQEAMSLLSNQ